jgi:hypothetical protein
MLHPVVKMVKQVTHDIASPAANHAPAAVSFIITGPYTTRAVGLQSREDHAQAERRTEEESAA